jgi:hypothetical protein
MSTLLNRPSAAYTNITYLFDKFLLPNTMYTEGGGPCGETPPALASSIQDMVLFSRRFSETDGFPIIEVFPGVASQVPPNGPGNIAFSQLLAKGGWLISAQWLMVNGTQFVSIERATPSTAGVSTNIRLRVRSFGASSPGSIRVIPTTTPSSIRRDGDIDVTMKNNKVTFYVYGMKPPFDIVPDQGTPAEFNSWGLH